MDFMRTSLATIIGLATLTCSGAVQAAELPVSSPVGCCKLLFGTGLGLLRPSGLTGA